MNVCFLVSTLSSVGGTGRVTANIANRMCADHQVHVVGIYGGADSLPAFDLDSRIVRLNILDEEERIRELATKFYRPFKRYLKENKIDIVFLIGNYQGTIALPVVLTSSVKFVFCDHGALMNQWDCKDVRFMRRMCSLFADATVTLTEQSKLDYIEKFRTPPRKVYAIPNWIPNSQIDKQASYSPDSKKIIWAGRIDPEKGVDLLVKIAGTVLAEHPDWSWDAYGQSVVTESSTDWQRVIDDKGLTGKLNLMGSVSDLVNRYEEYSICTLTSYREGLPMSLLEAKAKALPLVSFDVQTGPNEIIDDGKDGFLVTCYDCDEYARKLGQLMDDAEMRKAFSEHSKTNIERFSEDRIYEQWSNLINSLCGL